MNKIWSSLVVAMLVFVSVSFAQDSKLKRGDKYFRHFNFVEAADAYKVMAEKNPNDMEAKEKLANTYFIMDDYENAEIWYGQLAKTANCKPIDKLMYGQCLRANGKYAEANQAFNDYFLVAQGDPRAKELKDNFDKVKTLALDGKNYEVTNISQNSAASDMGSAFYKDGIIFSSNRGANTVVNRVDEWTGKRFYDIYVVDGDQNGNLNKVSLLKGKQPNRKYHEGPATISADGKEMFFTRSNYVKNKAKHGADKSIKLKIFHADYNEQDKRWTNIQELPFNNNEYSVGHPALSKDGKKLYFISDMPGGLGETDLYVSNRENGSWGKPINLGKGVNTAGREMFPFIADDGTLYFASDSRVGLGGLDVYSATFTSGEWGNVQNLGAPVNTNKDDFGYIIDAKNENGYFVSNRTGGMGDDDIYKFKKQGMTLCGTVVDAQTKELIKSSDVVLTFEGSGGPVKFKTDDKGAFCFNKAQPNKEYKITADKEGYLQNGVNFRTPNTRANQVVQIPLSKKGGIDLTVCVTEKGKGTAIGAMVEITDKSTGEKRVCTIDGGCACKFDLQPETTYEVCATKESSNPDGSYDHPCKGVTTIGKSAPANIQENIELTYLEEKMVIEIPNLYYDLNKWNIRPDAALELNKVMEIMKKFPAMEIELSSHTDCRGSMKYNDILSSKRAKSCVDYLIANGIDSKRMIAAGYGERKLKNDCACEGNIKSTCSEQEHQVNRRTEFKILKLK